MMFKTDGTDGWLVLRTHPGGYDPAEFRPVFDSKHLPLEKNPEKGGQHSYIASDKEF